MEPTTNPVPPSQQSQSPPQSDGSDINHLVVLQPGERVICDIRRHPFGLFSMYFSAAFVVIVILAIALLGPSYVTGMSQQVKSMIQLGGIIVAALTLLYTYIATTIYNANRWIVTSDSITQVTQTSLFSRETSQLSLANLEDVTVDQSGVLQSMFGFGTLRAESAGARGKFFFAFCPNPNVYARQVIEAHEAYIANKPDETVRGNRLLTTTDTYNQPSA